MKVRLKRFEIFSMQKTGTCENAQGQCKENWVIDPMAR
jgi:hypothetical protein